MSQKQWKNAGLLILSILLAQSAGLLGALFTFEAIPNWYATLTLPVFSPPNWVFGPVWTVLYTFMGIAAFLVWQKRGQSGVAKTLVLYLIHLVVNAAWSIVFFGLQLPGAALIVIVTLLGLIVAISLSFRRYSTPAFWLMVPYMLWVSFATVLNAGIWLLN